MLRELPLLDMSRIVLGLPLACSLTSAWSLLLLSLFAPLWEAPDLIFISAAYLVDLALMVAATILATPMIAAGIMTAAKVINSMVCPPGVEKGGVGTPDSTSDKGIGI